jgi:hypothetical protein
MFDTQIFPFTVNKIFIGTQRKNFLILIITAASFLTSIFSSCDQYKPILNYLKHGADTMYVVLYADSVNFTNIFYIDTLYKLSRDHYSLSPSDLESQFWSGGRPNKPDFNRKNYYARIIGISDDNVFYTSAVHYRVNRETKLNELEQLGKERHSTVTLETPKGLIDVPVDSLK